MTFREALQEAKRSNGIAHPKQGAVVNGEPVSWTAGIGWLDRWVLMPGRQVAPIPDLELLDAEWTVSRTVEEMFAQHS